MFVSESNIDYSIISYEQNIDRMNGYKWNCENNKFWINKLC